MIKRIFIRGLLALAPIALTVAIIAWLYEFIENITATIIIDSVGPQYYFPGLGIICLFILIFIVGVVINNWLAQKLYSWFEKLMTKMPLVKTLYQSISDLMSFFKGDTKSHGPVVMIEIQGMRCLGLVSRDHFEDVPKGIGKEGEVAVYIPLSYQIGGLTVVVPKSAIKPIDMTIEEGLRFAATAATGQKEKQDS